MTVGELIRKLKTFDEDSELFTRGNETGTSTSEIDVDLYNDGRVGIVGIDE